MEENEDKLTKINPQIFSDWIRADQNRDISLVNLEQKIELLKYNGNLKNKY